MDHTDETPNFLSDEQYARVVSELPGPDSLDRYYALAGEMTDGD